jgi:hypothetical protein
MTQRCRVVSYVPDEQAGVAVQALPLSVVLAGQPYADLQIFAGGPTNAVPDGQEGAVELTALHVCVEALYVPVVHVGGDKHSFDTES